MTTQTFNQGESYAPSTGLGLHEEIPSTEALTSGELQENPELIGERVHEIREQLRRLVGEYMHAIQATIAPGGKINRSATTKPIGEGIGFSFFRLEIGGERVEGDPELAGVKTVTITTEGEVLANAFIGKTILHKSPGLKTRAFLASCNAILGLGRDAEYVVTHDPLLNSQAMTIKQLEALGVLLSEFVSTADRPTTVDTSGDQTRATVTLWDQKRTGYPQMEPDHLQQGYRHMLPVPQITPVEA